MCMAENEVELSRGEGFAAGGRARGAGGVREAGGAAATLRQQLHHAQAHRRHDVRWYSQVLDTGPG